MKKKEMYFTKEAVKKVRDIMRDGVLWPVLGELRYQRQKYLEECGEKAGEAWGEVRHSSIESLDKLLQKIDSSLEVPLVRDSDGRGLTDMSALAAAVKIMTFTVNKTVAKYRRKAVFETEGDKDRFDYWNEITINKRLDLYFERRTNLRKADEVMKKIDSEL